MGDFTNLIGEISFFYLGILIILKLHILICTSQGCNRFSIVQFA